MLAKLPKTMNIRLLLMIGLFFVAVLSIFVPRRAEMCAQMGTSQAVVLQVDSLRAASHDGGVDIEWQGSHEVNTLGYNIYREEDGQRIKLNSSEIASSMLRDGSRASGLGLGEYSWTDTDGGMGSRYYIEAVDMSGGKQIEGVVEATEGEGALRGVRVRSRMLEEMGVGSEARITGEASRNGAVGFDVRSRDAAERSRTESVVSTPQQTQFGIAGAAATKIMVNKSGWYRVTQAALVAAGYTASNPVNLQLYANGVEQPIRVNSSSAQLSPGDSIEFYGLGLDTPVTDTQVYWLVAGSQAGKRVATVGNQVLTGSAPQNFLYTVQRKDRTVYFATSLPGIDENFFGPGVTATSSAQTITLNHVDASAGTAAVLEVALQGFYLMHHDVKVLFNGVQVGTMSFNSLEHPVQQFQIPVSSLQEGNNTVQFLAASGDASFVDYYRLTYAHTYQADSDVLSLSAPGGQALTVGSFSGPSIRVIDITDLSNIQELTPTVSQSGAPYTMSVETAGTGSRSMLAFVDSQAQSPASITANQPSNWNASHAADLVIIAYKDFIPSVTPLVNLRQSQGLRVVVVDVEDVYDEFSYGLHGPQGIKDFLTWTSTQWSPGPHYVLLVGSGTYDPRNYYGEPANLDLVPTKLVPTSFTQAASDEWLVDFNGDNVGELAVGRLPSRTKAEADLDIGKIVNFTPGRLNQSALFVADAQENYPISFQDENNQIIPLMPQSMNIEIVNRDVNDSGPHGVAHTQLINDLNAGPMVVNYAGHGNLDVWTGDPDFFGNPYAAALTNGSRLPLVVVMNCLNGYFIEPRGECLGATLMNNQNGGGVAVWASSGETVPGGQEDITKQFYKLLFAAQEPPMGEAARASKLATTDQDVRATWIFLGDPSMKLFNNSPTAAATALSGKVTTSDGAALGGVVITLAGSVTAEAITDGEGNYSFDGLEAGGFYTVTPSLSNYSFNPSNRSFSLVSNRTDAVFTASPNAIASANAIDTPEFFVRQQYLDFLGREPDAEGLTFWSDQINACNGDPACTRSKRIAVSAAFFTSQEFAETGSFVYRLYRASFGRQPTFGEFMSDRSKVIGGADLAPSKKSFAEDWVNRDTFKTLYPDSLTSEQFVNKLFDAADLSPYVAERQQWISAMGTGATRVDVLNGVIDDAAFKQREYNPSFVLMQYFGYLRRDVDAQGYAFWLSVLNQETENYGGMVCSFITSAEYQSRFGPTVSHTNRECGP